MFYLARKLYKPEFFQGNRRLGKPSRYFEGWYSFMRFMECYHGVIGLYTGGKLHSFTTYNGSRLNKIEYDDSSVWIAAEREQTLLRIRARRQPGVQLASPIQGEMRGRIEETLGSEISVELSRGGRQLFSDRGVHTGLEVVNPALLLQGIVSLKAE